MDAPFSSSLASDLDRRVIAGWAAIEHGDIREARAALSDVYAVDPAHPALPLLAAGIRRTRPKRITWRSAVLVLLIAAGAAYVVQWMRTRAVQEATLSPAASADELAAEQPALTPPSTGTASVGTSGQNVEPSSTAKETAPDAVHTPATDDQIIRQGIARFTTAYSRWTPLAFGSCDISRGGDSATVTCLARGTQPSSETESGGTWEFSFRKMDDSWKIVSIQPPHDSP
jgi:hypothetical protein